MTLNDKIRELVESMSDCALNGQEVEEVTDSLTFFVERAIEKYVKGKLEHGGYIGDRNLDEEMSNEIIDLFFYNEAKRRKNDRF